MDGKSQAELGLKTLGKTRNNKPKDDAELWRNAESRDNVIVHFHIHLVTSTQNIMKEHLVFLGLEKVIELDF